MTKALCLDFDGVLVDSTRECLYIAIESYKELHKEQTIQFNEIEYKKLVKLRPMVRGAKEYLNAIEIVRNNININTHDLFSKFSIKKLYEENSINTFKKIFYKKRHDLMSFDIKYWISLHDYYFEIFDLIKDKLNINKKEMLFIISLKDKNSISTLLKYKGIKNLPLILDCKDINNKPMGLDLICKQYNLKKNEILFIDDNPLHLNECIAKGYKNSYMPSWNKICKENIINFDKLNLIDNKLINKSFY